MFSFRKSAILDDSNHNQKEHCYFWLLALKFDFFYFCPMFPYKLAVELLVWWVPSKELGVVRCLDALRRLLLDNLFLECQF
jgi:hypothetical protein